MPPLWHLQAVIHQPLLRCSILMPLDSQHSCCATITLSSSSSFLQVGSAFPDHGLLLTGPQQPCRAPPSLSSYLCQTLHVWLYLVNGLVLPFLPILVHFPGGSTWMFHCSVSEALFPAPAVSNNSCKHKQRGSFLTASPLVLRLCSLSAETSQSPRNLPFTQDRWYCSGYSSRATINRYLKDSKAFFHDPTG